MNEETFHDAVLALELLSQEEKAPEAWRKVGEQTLEDFWRAWPGIRAWGEWLYTLVDGERAERASSVTDPELDETGEGAGG